MANIMVAISYPTSPQANKLCELLGNDLAWAYPIKLWGWALANECAAGVVHLPNERHLKQICGYFGRRPFLESMLSAGIIESVGDSSFRIKGWDVHDRYFKEKVRLASLWKNKNSRVSDASSSTRDDTHKSRDPIPSHPIPSIPGPISNEPGGGNAGSDLRANSAALALEKFYLEERGGTLLTRLPPSERVALDELMAITSDPKAVIEHYLADKREYYDKRKWPLSLLVENINEHTAGDTPDGESLYAFLKREGAKADG